MTVTGKLPRNVRTASKQTWRRRKERGWGERHREGSSETRRASFHRFFFHSRFHSGPYQWAGRSPSHQSSAASPKRGLLQEPAFTISVEAGRHRSTLLPARRCPSPARRRRGDDAAATQQLNKARATSSRRTSYLLEAALDTYAR